ncbi:inactive rhomboid protein 1 isoform X1 [Plutella xylostella]|nr:inactive rhomboid protein 1 isoform X1 [Plutella xylostella]
MAEEYARSPCERFPAAGAFSVAPPPERLSPPPPAPLPDRFSASPRRVRRCAEAERARRPRYVPPAAHVPVERYVPRPPAPVRPPPPVYCGLACRPPPPRKCCSSACREERAGSPPPPRYAEYVGAAARRLACTPPPPPPPALQLPCDPQEPPCCLQARRRPQNAHDWRSSAGLLAPQLSCQTASPAAPPASPPRAVSAPSAPLAPPPPEPTPQPAHEDGVRLRRAHTLAVRDYLKRETQTFFGVQRDNEREQRRLWHERRRRHAARALGDLRLDLPPDHHPDVDDISMYGASGAAPREARGRGRPDVLPAHPAAPLEGPPPRPGKDSVARLTLAGLSYVVTAVTRKSRQSASAQWSRSFRGSAPAAPDDEVDDVFFSPPTSPPHLHRDGEDTTDGVKSARSPLSSSTVEYRRPERSVSWGAGGARIHTPMLEPLADNSNRRQYGMGVVGRFFRRSLRKSVTHQEDVARQLDALTDYRPYFTWWVSTAQTLVLLLSLLCYGFGPVGFGRHTHSGQVLVKSLSLQQVEWEEPASFWLGPRAADLIHLGAKFAPCMRRDARIARAIAASARRERDTACCIRNDDSGCVQSSKADCSIRGLIPKVGKNTISTWKKWSSGESGPGGRISGSVCGLDPKFCEAPRSIAPHEWPDDITKWPICRKSVLDGSQAAGRAGHAAEHMACEVIGHPCCIGVHGQCVITTKEHCDFVKGYFHEEASLCSQVSCLDDVCGMLPFMRRRRPDQLYRAWTSLFVHAGLLHLAFTLALQWLFMRDLEKMAGPVRIATIYLGSGVAGNMASAIFEPYRAEVGPAGSHFGLLACLLVEVLGAWPLLRHPRRALLKLLSLAALLFLLGLLPWIDNFANVFGFVFGFFLSFALLPFITLGIYERRRKIVLVWVCLFSAGGMLCALVALFYAAPAYECAACAYFTCLPFAPDMCSSQDVRVRQLDGV